MHWIGTWGLHSNSSPLSKGCSFQKLPVTHKQGREGPVPLPCSLVSQSSLAGVGASLHDDMTQGIRTAKFGQQHPCKFLARRSEASPALPGLSRLPSVLESREPGSPGASTDLPFLPVPEPLDRLDSEFSRPEKKRPHTRVSEWCVRAKSLQSSLTLCDPVDCSPPGSSVLGILQARILEWLPCPPSGNVPNPGIKPVPLIFPALAGGFFPLAQPGRPL